MEEVHYGSVGPHWAVVPKKKKSGMFLLIKSMNKNLNTLHSREGNTFNWKYEPIYKVNVLLT